MTKSPSAIQPFQVRQAMVALELGPTDNNILEYLDFFTREIPTGAMYFLHVLPKFDLLNTMMEREAQALVSNYEINDEVISRMERKIRSRLTDDHTIHIEFDVKEGNPLEELLEDTNDVKADLVVIGQKSGASQHGILAKNLARKAQCNALVIPDKAKARIKKILVPVDFSEYSIKALRTAVALNQELFEPAEILCLNVYEIPNLSVYKIQKTKEQFQQMLEKDHMDAFQAFLNTHIPEYKENIKVELVCREGSGIAQHIMDYAGNNKADLIVMGAKGHSQVELLLMGSVTEKLLAIDETIPTLIVK
ncbi:MAG: universal stress protein [Phaeodactylibacter sp.]|nr:universal stress protein [Phaeodactylibacter sp.]MCB9264032.1 universal stress protein [Lewinellaceae bacterium]MCB9289892.1 universal stress protein [Lewinellaceae bacterium]